MPYDHTPDLSLDVRAVQVDHLADSSKKAAGLHSVVQTNASSRATEVQATKTPFIPKLLPMEDTMLKLELKYRQPIIRNGEKVKEGLYGMVLYQAIAGAMQKNGYPTITFMYVRDVLNSEFINVARQYYIQAQNEAASLKLID
jgi:hypothetical protein